jgi:hypothetical protein
MTNPTLRKVLREARRGRSLASRSSRPVNWRDPVDGRAPRLGPHEYIGHDVRGRGAWAHRDPLRVPRLWTAANWGALAGLIGLTAGAGWRSWRQHGGKEFLLRAYRDEG